MGGSRARRLSLRCGMVHLIGCFISERLVQPSGIVKPKVVSNADPGFSDVLVVAQIYVLIFYRSPQTFDKNIVEGSPSPVHAELDALAEYRTHKLL